MALPYLKDRPQSLHRHVDGWQGKEFWQRISRTQPPWVRTARANNRKDKVVEVAQAIHRLPDRIGAESTARLPGKAAYKASTRSGAHGVSSQRQTR